MGLGRVKDAWTKQVFAVRQVVKSIYSKWERYILGVYEFGKAYYTIDRHGLW